MALMALLTLTSCFGPVPKSELLGTFWLDAEWGCGTMILRSDSTFREEVSFRCVQPTRVLEGKWSTDSEMATRIHLSPFLSAEINNKLQEVGYLDTGVDKLSMGRLRIMLDPDAGSGWIKKR